MRKPMVMVRTPDNRHTPIGEFLARLPDTAVVCEVGGGGSRQPRADWVIDILPFDSASIRRHDRVSRDRWIQHDICAPGQWPVPDDAFDFTICSHVLEDVRDPLHVIRELARVSPAGYVETPGRAYESARSRYGKVPGSLHHRWLVEQEGDGTLVFIFKHGLLTEFSSLQISRHVPLTSDLVRLYWDRESAPLRARERVIVDPSEYIADCLSFRARFEGISEVKARCALAREQLAKRVFYKLLRTLHVR